MNSVSLPLARSIVAALFPLALLAGCASPTESDATEEESALTSGSGNVALVWQNHGEGMALVKDLPGAKQVTFHYLAPDGTWKDTDATAIGTPRNGQQYFYVKGLPYGGKAFGDYKMQFAVRYHVGGQEFWDNNANQNYTSDEGRPWIRCSSGQVQHKLADGRVVTAQPLCAKNGPGDGPCEDTRGFCALEDVETSEPIVDAPAHIATGPAFHRGVLVGYGGTPDGTTSGSAPSSPGLTMLAITKGLKAIQIVGSVDGANTQLLAGFPMDRSGDSPVELEATFASANAKNVTFHINFVSDDGRVEKYDNLGKDFACTIDGSDRNDHEPVRMSCDIPLVGR